MRKENLACKSKRFAFHTKDGIYANYNWEHIALTTINTLLNQFKNQSLKIYSS